MAFSKLVVALALAAAPQVSAMGMARPMCQELETFGPNLDAGNTKDCTCCIDYDYCEEMGIEDCIGYELTQEEINAVNEGPPDCTDNDTCYEEPPCTVPQCRSLVGGLDP